MSIRSLGILTLDIVAKIGGFTSGLDKAEREAQKRAAAIEKAFENAFTGITAGFAVVAAAGVAALAAINAQADTIASYQDLSDKVGDSAEAIAALQLAATVSGTSIDEVAAASVRLTASLSKTDDESKSVGIALKAIGIEFDAFKKLSPVEQLEAVAKALNQFADGAGKTAIATALFGKAGADLLKFFKDLDEQGGRTVGLTKEQIAAADDYTKATARLKAEFNLFIQPQSTQFIPVLSQVQSLLADVAKNETVVEAITTVLNVAIKAAVVVFQALAVIGSDVAFVLLGVGREIGAIIAQAGALARMDLQGFNAISDAVKADGARARVELDAFQKRVMSIGQPVYMDDEVRRLMARSSTQQNPGKPTLRPPPLSAGSAGKKDNTAEQEAKAQLASDLEAIRNALSLMTSAYANSEKVLSAMRSAGLTEESDYYQQRKQLLDQTTAAQVDAQQKTIERLQQETVTGKEAIDNAKKIAEAQTALAKIQADGVTQVKVLGIEQESAYNKARNAILSARQAAQGYLETVNQGYSRELAGIGQGSKLREMQAGLTQIEQRYQQQRQDLQNLRAQAELAGTFGPEAKKQFEEQIAVIDEFQTKAIDSYKGYYATLEEAQGNWINGALEGLKNYADEAGNVAKHMEDTVGNALKGLEDQFTNLLTGKKFDGKKLLEDLNADLMRNFVKENITGPLAKLGGDLFGLGGSSGGVLGSSAAKPMYVRSADPLGAVTGGASGSSSGGLVGQLFSGAAKLFGGFGNSTATAMANVSGGGLDDLFKYTNNFGSWATGGFTGIGSKYEPAGIVHKGEYVLTAEETRAMGVGNLNRGDFGGGRRMTVNNNFTINQPTTRKTQQQIAAESSRAMRSAEARMR